MRLRVALASFVYRRIAEPIMLRRPADQIIGGPQGIYLVRWFAVPRNRLFNIYLHRILRSDDDRALHDHPWFNLSLILSGYYIEHTIASGGVHRRALRGVGDIKARAPWAAHRLEVDAPCVTLFLTGPKMRSWGFHCPHVGWVHWRRYPDCFDERGNTQPQQ
jgi:hypothetical protein